MRFERVYRSHPYHLTNHGIRLRGEQASGDRTRGAHRGHRVATLFFIPIFWLVLNGFKDELDANSISKRFLDMTLDRFCSVIEEIPGQLIFMNLFVTVVARRDSSRGASGLLARHPPGEKGARCTFLLRLDEALVDRRRGPSNLLGGSSLVRSTSVSSS